MKDVLDLDVAEVKLLLSDLLKLFQGYINSISLERNLFIHTLDRRLCFTLYFWTNF